MGNNFFTKATIYSINNPAILLEELTKLIDDFKEHNIYLSINHLDIKQVNNLVNDNKRSLQLFLSNNIFWIFAKDIEESFTSIQSIEFSLKNLISKINITNKVFIDTIFRNEFSDNLLEINIEGDDLVEFEEETLTGSFINKTFEFRDIINFNDIQITYIKLQPLNLNAVITLRRPNIVEFSEYIDKRMLIDLIKYVSQYINKTNKKLIYFEGDHT